MTYCFLLNNTRDEAILIPDVEGEEEYLYTINLTKSLRPYQHLIKSWSFTDDILLYQPQNDISYSTLDKYRALNFTTYNKEAHLINV